MAAEKRSACLRCWFATEGTIGSRITLHYCWCRSRYFTILLFYVRTWRISSFSGLYWKLTKRRQKTVGMPSLLIRHPRYDWKTDNSSGILLPLTILYRSILLCLVIKNLEFQWLILKIDETAAKKRSACLLCWFATNGTTGRQITLQRSYCLSRYFTVLLYYARP